MTKQHFDDFKLSAVKLYLKFNMRQVKSITVGDWLNKRHLLMPFVFFERREFQTKVWTTSNNSFRIIRCYSPQLIALEKVSEILNCSKSSLHRWVERYFETGNIKRKNYKNKISIITNDILKFIIGLIKINPTITLSKIKKKIIKKYKIDISISYLFYIIKYKLNLTNKQLRRKYYPK